MSVLLSHPHDVKGGTFMTYDHATGQQQHHSVARGDALLFHSEKMHNVAPITEGVRHSFVVELWLRKPNGKDRHS